MAIPVCPTDCTSQIPEVNFSDCSPETNAAQIVNIYVTNVGYPFDPAAATPTDWTVAADWIARIDNTNVNPDAIRKFHVIGSKPVAEKQEKEISHNRTVTGPKKHSIAFRIDETNNVNYEMLRSLECGGSFLIWYETSGGKMYGGNEGIKASLMLDQNIPESLQEIELFEGMAKWTSKFHPERIDSPIAVAY
jgi:hypothetical protein